MLHNLCDVIHIHKVNVDTLLYWIENGDFKINSDICETVHKFIQDSDRL